MTPNPAIIVSKSQHQQRPRGSHPAQTETQPIKEKVFPDYNHSEYFVPNLTAKILYTNLFL